VWVHDDEPALAMQLAEGLLGARRLPLHLTLGAKRGRSTSKQLAAKKWCFFGEMTV
jgi:hypothetical protein